MLAAILLPCLRFRCRCCCRCLLRGIISLRCRGCLRRCTDEFWRWRSVYVIAGGVVRRYQRSLSGQGTSLSMQTASHLFYAAFLPHEPRLTLQQVSPVHVSPVSTSLRRPRETHLSLQVSFMLPQGAVRLISGSFLCGFQESPERLSTMHG